MRPVRRAPEQHEPEQYEDVGGRVEQAVPAGIDLKVADAVGRIPGARQHVMPLEHLMEDDPIEESSEAQSEEDAGRDRKSVGVVLGAAHAGAGLRCAARISLSTSGAPRLGSLLLLVSARLGLRRTLRRRGRLLGSGAGLPRRRGCVRWLGRPRAAPSAAASATSATLAPGGGHQAEDSSRESDVAERCHELDYLDRVCLSKVRNLGSRGRVPFRRDRAPLCGQPRE